MSLHYKNIELNILEKYFRHLLQFNPVLGQINSAKKIHPGGFHYSHDNKELNTELKRIESTMELKYEDIKSFNLEAFSYQIYSFAEQRLNKMEAFVLDSISAVTKLTGNIVNNRGKPLTEETILEMLEKIEIRFDENGNFNLPSIIVSPESMKLINQIKPGSEYQKKYQEIIDKKKTEYYAKKCSRRLSYINI